MSGRYVHNNGQFQQMRGFDLDLTIQRYRHDAGHLTGHAGKFLHWLDLGVEAPHFGRAIEYVNDFEGRDDARPFYLSPAPIAPP